MRGPGATGRAAKGTAPAARRPGTFEETAWT